MNVTILGELIRSSGAEACLGGKYWTAIRAKQDRDYVFQVSPKLSHGYMGVP